MRKQMRAMRLTVFTHRTVRAWAPLGNLETELMSSRPLPEGPDQSTSKGCEADQSKPDKEMEAQENSAAYSELELE